VQNCVHNTRFLTAWKARVRLGTTAGIQTPEVKLVKLAAVDPGGLTGLSIPQWETRVYAIKRYDRTADGRVHVEDFAQVFNVHADQEYKTIFI
jgi:serine/threonine-protein kinase HipA